MACAAGLFFAVALGAPSPAALWAGEHGVVRAHWWAVMVCFYVFVLAQSSGMPALMALYMKPFGDIAGLASGVQNLLRTSISTGVAAIGTKITQEYGPSGLLATMGGCLACAVLWGTVFLGCGVRGATGDEPSAAPPGPVPRAPSAQAGGYARLGEDGASEGG